MSMYICPALVSIYLSLCVCVYVYVCVSPCAWVSVNPHALQSRQYNDNYKVYYQFSEISENLKI